MNRATSLFLDVVRPIAALLVFLSHLCAGPIVQIPFVGRMGWQAVDIFFVLSGFVIAHATVQPGVTASGYAVSRAVRILSVALPAIAVTFVLDAIGKSYDPSVYTGYYQAIGPGVLARSVTFLGEQWNNHRVPGSDLPYWSLSFEVWYYIIFAIAFFAPGRWRWIGAGAAVLFIGPKVAVLLPIWLLGVGTHRLCCRRSLSPRLAWSLFAASGVLLICFQFVPHADPQEFAPLTDQAGRLMSTAQNYCVAILFAMMVLGFSSLTAVFEPVLVRFEKPIRWLAGATFTIYLMHAPVLTLIIAATPFPRHSVPTLLLALIATPLVCLALAEWSERRKTLWRRAADRLLGHWMPRRPA